MDIHPDYNNYTKFIRYIYDGGIKMKKLILILTGICICLTSIFLYYTFSDSLYEERIEDLLDAKYGYISDDSKYLELDFDVHKEGKDIYINIKVEDDFYIAKTDFDKNVFDSYVKEAEQTAKSKAKGKNVIVNSYF
jgi:hypothetical protein